MEPSKEGRIAEAGAGSPIQLPSISRSFVFISWLREGAHRSRSNLSFAIVVSLRRRGFALPRVASDDRQQIVAEAFDLAFAEAVNAEEFAGVLRLCEAERR